MARHVRLAAEEHGGDQIEQLPAVDRAAAELEVHRHVVGDGGARGERGDGGRRRVDGSQKLVDPAPVPQGLDATCRGAGADRDQKPALAADLADPLHVVGRGDRALHESHVVGPRHHLRPGLEEVVDLHAAGELEQPLLGVEQLQLAAVARGELEHGESGLGGHSCGTRIRSAIRS
jgi:hypothetical protein